MRSLIGTFSFVALLFLILAPSFVDEYCSASDLGLLARSRDQLVGKNGAAVTPVSAKDLPTEARDTLRLIKEGGPFPYPRDGITFGNREGHLPSRPHGYYREYTVKTPGRHDRGARRIVAGRDGECYYTDDHYRTFRLIKE